MSKKGKQDWREELKQVADQLRDPVRMRIVVAFVAIAIMMFGINDPLHGRTKKSRRSLKELQQRVSTAEEVLLLRDSMENLESRIIQGEGSDPVTSFFINLFRQSPVDFNQINVEAAQRLGPVYSVRTTIDLSGSFEELSQALHLIESQDELLRIESLKISPAERGAPPSMQLAIRLLKEKA
ncbi:MAG: hypothetical protein AAFX06_07885 [Planctomycetota bacterium]